ncbi:adenine deaminase [Chryseobacterium fistulae]|uniref:Adenine deaminase n=1 Tax=Chryseobacterium fistulae TaxID=2675058 RepID=A0A6N4XN69_9FLAO|nr:adenine deaminase [Chryseobacterium fistulae]CAA7387393.1 Adenine deaminase [Chryseobacterium fistulae]
MTFTIQSNLIDLVSRETYPAEIIVDNGKITSIKRINEVLETYILPGFIDSHVHIESSMLVPSEFARIAVQHGSVGTISDPHEIANVLGVSGVEYMIENATKVPFHFYFGAPSCVPATDFETAGAVIDADDIEKLLNREEIVYLAEMMNFPGVIYQDTNVLKKLALAKQYKKPIDGHAPGLMGEDMQRYFSAGITTDHECFGYTEALEKLKYGVNIMIREGSAAKNFETLIPLLKEFPDQIMFCCDDKHPDDLIESHINYHVKRALEYGHDLYDVLRASSYNVIKHYHLPIGLLQPGDNADFIVIDNLENFTILKTYINGILVAENGHSYIQSMEAAIVNKFHCNPKQPDDFKIKTKSEKIRVIEVLDRQLITHELHMNTLDIEGYAESNIEDDVLKIAVVNRYHDAPVSVAFIKNVGLKTGAIASCVAHDSHNIVVVGTNDEDMCKAVNAIIKAKGGISLATETEELVLELPIAGIMTNCSAEKVAADYITLDLHAKKLGSTLKAPYMSLSFMALLVIPELKLSDKGLFNGKEFQFADVFIT